MVPHQPCPCLQESCTHSSHLLQCSVSIHHMLEHHLLRCTLHNAGTWPLHCRSWQHLCGSSSHHLPCMKGSFCNCQPCIRHPPCLRPCTWSRHHPQPPPHQQSHDQAPWGRYLCPTPHELDGCQSDRYLHIWCWCAHLSFPQDDAWWCAGSTGHHHSKLQCTEWPWLHFQEERWR